MASLLALYVSFWARLFIRRTGIRIIAVTGSVGKTTTHAAIRAAVEDYAPVRAVRGNFNVPFGVAMGILGGGWDDRYFSSGGGNWFWFKASLAAPFLALFGRPTERFVLVEYGADRPGDMQWLVDRFPPHIAVITAVGDTPVHLEYYASPHDVAAEKAKLLSRLRPGDTAVLNADDLTVLEMKDKVAGSVITFGMASGAQVRAAGIEVLTDSGVPEGIMFTVHADGTEAPLRFYGVLGRSQAYAAAAAVAVAAALGVDAADALVGLANYRPASGRLRLLKGIKHSTIIDDSYNSSPMAVHNALDMLKVVPAKRRIAVLGDMLELGGKTVSAHQAAGDMAGSIADVLVCVGEKSKFTVDSAANQMLKEDIHWYRSAGEAGLKVQELIEEGDVILVKGSQGMRMERVVKEIMAEPERSNQQLVRQTPRWLRKT